MASRSFDFISSRWHCVTGPWLHPCQAFLDQRIGQLAKIRTANEINDHIAIGIDGLHEIRHRTERVLHAALKVEIADRHARIASRVLNLEHLIDQHGKAAEKKQKDDCDEHAGDAQMTPRTSGTGLR